MTCMCADQTAKTLQNIKHLGGRGAGMFSRRAWVPITSDLSIDTFLMAVLDAFTENNCSVGCPVLMGGLRPRPLWLHPTGIQCQHC